MALQNQCLFSRNSSIIKELLVDRHSRELTAIEPLCHCELPSSCPSRRFLSLRYRIPDITTAPNGELRRQDFHLQVQQLVSLRSLQWVPWAAVPHLPRYYDPLRLPRAHLGVVRFSLSSPDTLHHSSFFVSLLCREGSCERLELPLHAGSLLPPRSALLFPYATQGDNRLSQVPRLPP